MKRFGFMYIGWMLLLFSLLYWDLSPVAGYINRGQMKLTLFFLEKSLISGQLQGIDIWINPHYKVIVTKACNGTIPILILWSAIFAYPVGWMYKFWWAVLGYVVLTSVNILRLIMVAYFVKVQVDFPLYHDLWGNMLLIVTGLLLFYLFSRGRRYHRLRR